MLKFLNCELLKLVTPDVLKVFWKYFWTDNSRLVIKLKYNTKSLLKLKTTLCSVLAKSHFRWSKTFNRINVA